ncbi:MAG: hypothetical protein JW774_10285 [Candidatus Aureabacteria bacterium]|nr:hypothetical protein [Candidatus Auribacterota bacterium]
MPNIIKLVFIAVGIVVVLTLGLLIGKPEFRDRILARLFRDKIEEIQEENEALKAQEEKLIKVEETRTSKQVDELASKLIEKEKNLMTREENLQLRESRFKEREEQLVARQKEVEDMLQKMTVYINEAMPLITDTEKKNLKKMARMFETLSPENANPMIAQMPDDTVVSILSYMKPRNSAKLLGNYASVNSEHARRAAKLAEMLKKLVIK